MRSTVWHRVQCLLNPEAWYGALHSTHYTVTVNAAHCTLYISYFTLYTVHSKLHTYPYTLYT